LLIAARPCNSFTIGCWRRQGLTWDGSLASKAARDVAVSGLRPELGRDDQAQSDSAPPSRNVYRQAPYCGVPLLDRPPGSASRRVRVSGLALSSNDFRGTATGRKPQFALSFGKRGQINVPATARGGSQEGYVSEPSPGTMRAVAIPSTAPSYWNRSPLPSMSHLFQSNRT
jgi:hypothetical protein